MQFDLCWGCWTSGRCEKTKPKSCNAHAGDVWGKYASDRISLSCSSLRLEYIFRQTGSNFVSTVDLVSTPSFVKGDQLPKLEASEHHIR